MAQPTKALFVDEHNHFSVIERRQLPKPAEGEVLIRVIFSGVNPADIKHAVQLGVNNTVLGYDFCGEVMGTASSDSPYQYGDIVAGYTPCGMGRPARYGTHQTFVACPEAMMFKVPDNLPQEDAACLTCVAMAAADALYNHFQFPLPTEQQPTGVRGGPLLLWGATSAVGFCALQFAVASGVSPIFVTGSPEELPLLKSVGATKCFDYKDGDAPAQIDRALEELGYESFEYAFDAAGVPISGDQVLQCRSVTEETQLLSVVARENKRFRMPLANTYSEFKTKVFEIPAQRENYRRAWTALQWAVEHYGNKFRLLPVRVMKDDAESVLQEIRRVVREGGGFSKLVVKQPMA